MYLSTTALYGLTFLNRMPSKAPSLLPRRLPRPAPRVGGSTGATNGEDHGKIPPGAAPIFDDETAVRQTRPGLTDPVQSLDASDDIREATGLHRVPSDSDDPDLFTGVDADGLPIDGDVATYDRSEKGRDGENLAADLPEAGVSSYPGPAPRRTGLKLGVIAAVALIVGFTGIKFGLPWLEAQDWAPQAGSTDGLSGRTIATAKKRAVTQPQDQPPLGQAAETVVPPGDNTGPKGATVQAATTGASESGPRTALTLSDEFPNTSVPPPKPLRRHRPTPLAWSPRQRSLRQQRRQPGSHRQVPKPRRPRPKRPRPGRSRPERSREEHACPPVKIPACTP